jgi:hypothetical protein
VGHYYVCGKRRHDNRKCEHARYHRAEELEERVRRFLQSILRNPAVIEEQIKLHADRERQRLRDPESQIAMLLEQKRKLKGRRERYLEQHAEGLSSLEDVKAKIAGLDKQEATVEKELTALRESELYLANLDRIASDFVREIPYLLELQRTIRPYETVRPRFAPDNPPGLYTLTPESIRFLDEEELAEKRRAEERKRSGRYRSVYEDLRLRLTAHRDGTLALEGVFGGRVLSPSEPPEPQPFAVEDTLALRERSVSHRTWRATSGSEA